MCGRLNVISDPLSQFLMDVLGVQYHGEDHYNLAPMSRVPILIQSEQKETEVLPMQWWLVPYWANTPSTKYSMFNARSETAAQSPAFKESYKKRRCLIPVSAYFEWTSNKGIKVPSMIRPKHDKGLFLAGLWDRWEKGSESIESFTVLTTEACAGLVQIHKRQPVMLNSEEALRWLDCEIPTQELESLLRPRLSVELELVPVSTYVNNSTNQGQECMESIGASKMLGKESSKGILH